MGRYPEEKLTYWCYARGPEIEPGAFPESLVPVPCRKEACERYRPEYPYCLMMERWGRKGRILIV